MESVPHIGLIVTGSEALQDFQIFCSSLEAWHPNAILYVLTDSETASTLLDLRALSIKRG